MTRFARALGRYLRGIACAVLAHYPVVVKATPMTAMLGGRGMTRHFTMSCVCGTRSVRVDQPCWTHVLSRAYRFEKREQAAVDRFHQAVIDA